MNLYKESLGQISTFSASQIRKIEINGGMWRFHSFVKMQKSASGQILVMCVEEAHLYALSSGNPAGISLQDKTSEKNHIPHSDKAQDTGLNKGFNRGFFFQESGVHSIHSYSLDGGVFGSG